MSENECQFSHQALPDPPIYNPLETNFREIEPPGAVLEYIPVDHVLTKNDELSSEFCSTEFGTISPEERSRWRYNRNWGGRFPGVFQNENVKFVNNALNLGVTKFKQPPGEMFQFFGKEQILEQVGLDFFGTSCFLTSSTMTFGYTEIGCRLSKSSVTCAFWLKEQSSNMDSDKNREIDIFEYTNGRQCGLTEGRGNIHMMTVHEYMSNDGCEDVKKDLSVIFDKNLSDAIFFKAGLLWTEEKLYFFVNDCLFWEYDHEGEFDESCKMHLILDREVFPWIENPDEQDLMQDFVVYYIRTWDLTSSE